MVKFSVISIHPEIAGAAFKDGLLKKAVEKQAVSFSCVNPRDFADPPHYRVDDRPYGGGPGMVMKVDPLVRAIRSVCPARSKDSQVWVLSAKGRRFTQKRAYEAAKLKHLVLVCGRYEGIDERVVAHYADAEIRLGDAVYMGGELAAGLIIESIARLLPNVLGNERSLEEESISTEMQREYPQYTRPPDFEGHKVPEVLVRGNHQEIGKWRRKART